MNEGKRGARYGLVGAGRLGCALAQALDRAGAPVTVVHSARRASAQALCGRLAGATVADDLGALCAGADRILLTVPDAQLAGVASQLPVAAGQSVIHASGASALAVLDACAARGAAVACFHPLQSFPSRTGGAGRFAGIAIGVEASAPGLQAELTALAQALGARPLGLSGVDRARYHAAAVFASNYLVALLQAATEAWTAAGLEPDDALPALLPLTAGVLDAVERAPLAEALTGPLCRGDVATVARQLEALADRRDLSGLYAALGRQLLGLGLPRDGQAYAALSRVLADADGAAED